MEHNATRKVIIIGNGFDLAHGLKTKYSDFLVWYFNDALQKAMNDPHKRYTDKLISLQVDNKLNDTYIKELSDIDKYQSWLIIKYPSKLFNRIYELANKRWVDIEYELFAFIIKNAIDLDNRQLTQINCKEDNILNINDEFEFLKKKFIEYINTIEEPKANVSIMNVFNDHIFGNDVTNYIDLKGIFINFNYTDTLSYYKLWLKDLFHNYKIINIHGEIANQVNNPIIFGYGDEMDPIYAEMERLNNNNIIKNFKSFSYLHTSNYAEIMRFLDYDADYEVFVLGHSCGISDRVLLSNVFDRKNCIRINLCYYDKDTKENDFIEKTQEVSRHFRPESKNEMRTKIVPFNKSISLNNYL